MKLKLVGLALALSATSALAADGTTVIPTFAGQAAAAADAKKATPKTPDEWLARMTDMTRNLSAFKDPKVFVPWTNAVTEPSFYIAMANGMVDPGSWLNMMNSAAHPDAVRNVVQFADPNIYLKWGAAGMDPAFYTALLTQLSDPGKAMRWAMTPLDPKLWNLLLSGFNPNTYIRWPMAGMDPRAWNLAGTMANPALYTGMAGAVVNPSGYGQGANTWLSWAPAPAVQGAGGFAMWDPLAMAGNLAGWIPGLNQIALPNFTLPTFPVPGAAVPGAAVPGAAVAAPAAKPAEAAKPAPAPAKAAEAKPAASKMVLAGDALFQSGKSGIKDLSKDGKAKLDEVVTKLKGLGEIEQIKVVGHADPTGDAKANQKLSEARAKSVKSYLIAKGVKPGVIVSTGMGDAQPVAQCDKALVKDALKECHAPNRRVEIEVQAKAAK
ncbi:MAG: OmpA family protein [Betaproteobacteria bacterium]|nr:OmpA family protein [Betaproteobacteria bacterium]